MTSFFNTVDTIASSFTNALSTDATVSFLVIGILVLGMMWGAFFDKYWVAYSLSPSKIARREMRIAAFAPITVPILAGMLIVKTAREIKTVTA